MIHHLSIAAHDPRHSAEVLAEIMGGKAVPFPPNPGSFFLASCSSTTTAPGSRSTRPGPNCSPPARKAAALSRKPREGRGLGATHFALSVAADAGKVKQIAERAGWHCVDLQSRAVPRDRGLGRKRYDGRGLAAGLRRRIPGLDSAPTTVATRMARGPSSRRPPRARARSA